MKLSEITAETCGLDDRYNVVLEEAPSMRKISTFEIMAESLENMIGETMVSQGIPLMGCIITDEFIRLVYIDGQPETSDDEFSVSMGHMMESDGTVRAKGIVHLARDEDRLCHLMNRSRMYQQSGKKSHSIYRMTTSANRQLSIDTARELIKIADAYDVDCIVFERLDSSGKKHGRMAQRIHMWRSRDVQERVELQAHRRGMRISRICAWGTSKLAFDGSGPVKRGQAAGKDVPYNICILSTGKQYNCDLGAAMNIGARYFLRAIAGVHKGIALPAVPQRTLSDLWRTADVLKAVHA